MKYLKNRNSQKIKNFIFNIPDNENFESLHQKQYKRPDKPKTQDEKLNDAQNSKKHAGTVGEKGDAAVEHAKLRAEGLKKQPEGSKLNFTKNNNDEIKSGKSSTDGNLETTKFVNKGGHTVAENTTARTKLEAKTRSNKDEAGKTRTASKQAKKASDEKQAALRFAGKQAKNEKKQTSDLEAKNSEQKPKEKKKKKETADDIKKNEEKELADAGEKKACQLEDVKSGLGGLCKKYNIGAETNKASV